MNSDRRGFFKRLFGLGAMVVGAKVVDLPIPCGPPTVTLPTAMDKINVSAIASNYAQSLGIMNYYTYTGSTSCSTTCTWVEMK